MADRDLLELPKAHLHMHFEGSWPREELESLGAKRGVDVSGIGNVRTLEEFMDQYGIVKDLVETLPELLALCEAVVAHEAKQGVIYMEPMFCPIDYEVKFGLTGEEIYRAMDEAFQRAAKREGVIVQYLIGVNRNQDINKIMAAVELAISKVRQGVVGFGYGGVERMDADKFVGISRRIKEAGLLFVPHAGEIEGARAVEEAVLLLGADRIAHGIRAVDDPKVLELLEERGVTCDVAVTSNLGIGAAGTVFTHPISELLKAGVKVTINADDEMFFSSSVADEFQLLRDVLGFNDKKIAGLARNSIEACGMEAGEKVKALKLILEWERKQLQEGERGL